MKKQSYKRLALYMSQLIMPGLLFYGFPSIYKAAFHSDSQFSLNYQWVLIIFLSSWGGGSLFAGTLMNRYGAYLGIILGYLLVIFAFIVLSLDVNYFIFVISALLMGLSLSFLMLDGVITYFEQNTDNINTFRRYVIELTFFSGFASTFAYFFVSPIFIYIDFKIAVAIGLFITIILLVLSNFSLSKVHFRKETKLLGNIYKSLISKNSLAITVIMLSQGTVQTIIFFEAFIFLQSKSFNTSFVLTSYAIIGMSQVIGRVIISRYNYWSSYYINLIANVFIFIGSILYLISIYSSIYILPVFSIIFGMGLGVSTISKPLLISDIFEHNFSFYNGFYSLVLNLSRVIIPILIMFHIISFSLIYLLCTGLILTCIGLVCSYLILIRDK